MAFSGVRSSCDRVARNSSFSALARSTFARAMRSASSKLSRSASARLRFGDVARHGKEAVWPFGSGKGTAWHSSHRRVPARPMISKSQFRRSPAHTHAGVIRLSTCGGARSSTRSNTHAPVGGSRAVALDHVEPGAIHEQQRAVTRYDLHALRRRLHHASRIGASLSPTPGSRARARWTPSSGSRRAAPARLRRESTLAA